MLRVIRKNALFGRYPSCDLINNAIRFLLEGKTDVAIKDLVRVIFMANGYFHEDVANALNLEHKEA